MTVVPIPVAPAPPAEPSSNDAGAPPPGFAQALANCRDDTATKDAPSAGKEGSDTPADGDGKPATPKALSDAAVVALLAAMTGVVQNPAPTTPSTPATSPTAVPVATTKGKEANANATPTATTTATPAPAPSGKDDHAPAPVTLPAPATATATATAQSPASNPTPAPPATAHHGGNDAEDSNATPAPASANTAAPMPAPPIVVPPTVHLADAPKLPPAITTALPAGGPVTQPQVATASTSAAAPSAAAATPAPPPAEQLVSVLRPLERGSDGSYHLRLELRPPELGRVEMRVEMKDGVMHASIRTEHAGTAEIVRNALDELRGRLESQGVRAGSLTVDSGGARTPDRERDATPEAPPADDRRLLTIDATDVADAGANPVSDSLLDVRM